MKKSKPKTMKIKEAEYLDGYRLRFLFSDGKDQVVNFGPFLQNATHPEMRKFLLLKRFKKFILLDGDRMWGDFDLIFPIVDLYHGRLEHSQNVHFSTSGMNARN